MPSWLPKEVTAMFTPAPPPPWYASVSLEHLPLAGYMSIIGVLLAIIFPSVSSRPKSRTYLHLFLALASLAFTWTYMVRFFEFSFIEAAMRANTSPRVFTTKAWLEDTSLFTEAWGRVCATARRWWWSEQLCAWTAGPFTIFLERESRLRNVKRPWAFMLLGQFVAISVAQNLFTAAHSLSTPGRTLQTKPQGRTLAVPLPNGSATTAGPSWLLCGCVLTSLITVALTPLTTSQPTFLPNLLVMHVLLLLPLVPSLQSSAGPKIAYSDLYLGTSFISLLLRLPTYYQLLPALSITALLGVGRGTMKTLFEHPAQSSIGYDIVFATLSFAVWMAVEYGSRKNGKTSRGALAVLGLVIMTPLVGVAVTGGLYLSWREIWEPDREKLA
ncbi:hypothetical protein P7C70_g2530, partial [Phenoliferia sp. Uapishka_3]